MTTSPRSVPFSPSPQFRGGLGHGAWPLTEPRLGRLAGSLSVVVGLVVLTGWTLGIPSLSSIIPGTLTMKANTAVAFVCIGGAVVLLPSADRRIRRFATWLAIVAAALAALTGSQYLTGIDLGVDQLLVREPAGTVGTVHPGRMSPQTGLALIALATGLLASRRSQSGPLVVALALVPILLGLLNALDALFGAATPTFLASYTQMALPTAALCVVLGLAVIDSMPDGGPFRYLRGPSEAARLGRRLVVAALAIPIVLGWLRLEGERAGLYDTAFGVALTVLSTVCLFVTVIWQSTRRLHVADAERERATASLRTALAEVNDLYESSPAGYHSLAPDGRIVRVNETELRWLGYRREEVVGRPFEDFLTPAGVDQFRSVFEFFKARGRISDLEYELVRKDGTTLPVLLTATAVVDEQGRFVMSRSTLVDISARREAQRAHEAAREAAREGAEAANRAKSEFLSRMSHELRTPLNAVLGFSQLLELGPLDDAQRDHVRYIDKAGRHLLDLINEVLDISRIESGTMSLSPEPVEVSGLVGEVHSLVKPLAGARQIAVDVPGADCRAHVLADRQRLRQVLLNLLSNAVKYNREGGTIDIRCKEVDRGRLWIGVVDSGRGIAPGQLDRLFVPFDRLGAEGTGIEGTGIGLALSKALVDAMGGTIGVDSEVGVGSTFWVELPIVEGPVETYTKAPVAASAVPMPALDGISVRRILYIDDNLSNVRLVERLLERRRGVVIVSAQQGRLGLELARTDPPELVLLDLHLPDIDGIEVLRELRADPTTRDVPVIVLSADAGSTVGQRLHDEGATAFLTKPLDLARFLAVVDEALRSSEPNERDASTA